MMYKCTECGAYFDKNDLEKITYDKGRKSEYVCPECLAELCNSLEEVSEKEEEEIRREWDMEAVYDRQFEEGIR